MPIFENLCSQKNLKLAWRRITTGDNHQYKRFFRDLYYAYEIAINDNLSDIQKRLKGASYQVNAPIRIYIPKPSGLQRPITLLSLEDQIIWQSVANVFAEQLRHRRKSIELKSVYSNILQKDKNSIFFTQNWHHSYGQLQAKIESYFNKGFCWIAHFDLAAFYDTICHDLLIRKAFPKSGASDFAAKVTAWLQAWSSDHSRGYHKHGIPQGPIASNFLAECFLLPIDEAMTKEFRYLRYVDDIRIFARTESEVRKAAVRLEVLCRERGLIPQGKKYAIKEAKSREEAMGTLPSIASTEYDDSNNAFSMPAKDAIRLFRKGLSGKPQRISDKSRIRYVLFNAEPSAKMVKYVARFLPHHPEHIDAFIYYFGHYKRSRTIIKTCKKNLSRSPYEYVQGELWHILARMMKAAEMELLVGKAVGIAKDAHTGFALKWGVCNFLCRAESAGLGNYSRFVQYQSPLLQSLLAAIIPNSKYAKNDVVAELLRRSSFEPGLILAEQFMKRRITFKDLGLRINQLPSQVINTYKALGVISKPKAKIDPMGEILTRRYNIRKWQRWHELLQSNYGHALQILSKGDAVFVSGRSEWLKYQNSFNDALFHSLQQYLQNNNLPGAAKLFGKNGKPVKYGVLLDPNQAFAKSHLSVARILRTCNERRNSLPGSHPYEEGGDRTRWLTKKEQNKIAKDLVVAYQEIIQIIET